MVTMKLLESIPPGTVFAKGLLLDSDDDVCITRTGKILKWVAIRGGIIDWAVYVGMFDEFYSNISRFGDKISVENACRLVCVTDDVRARYRN